MDQPLSASQARQPVPEAPEASKRPRHRWVWAVVLLLFGLLFYWVIHQQRTSQAAVTGGGRRMMTGPVPVTTATAQKGSIGVYLDEIGTVTPVYYDAITAQVTGVIT